MLKAHNDIIYHDEEQQQEQKLGDKEEEEQSYQSSSENNKKPIYESEDIVSIAKENCIDMMKRQQPQNGGASLPELLEGNTSDMRASSSSPRPRPRHDNSFWRTKVQWRWQSSSSSASSASRSESGRAGRLTGSGSNYCDDSQPLYSVVEHQKEDRRNVMVPFSGRACLLDII